jgi:hypothetical protein
MRHLLLLVIVLALGTQLHAQARIPISRPRAATVTKTTPKETGPMVTVPVLLDMLDWTERRIDTTLKKKGYLLMQKDVDSTSSLFQYSHLDRREEAPTTVRSLTFMDAVVGDAKGRMVSYRTYDREEFRDISSYLLANNYLKTNEFDFDETKHILYSNGKQEMRLKIITTKKEKRTFIAYELELGK